MAYDKSPYIPVPAARNDCFVGWIEIGRRISGSRVIAVECYPGVDEVEVARELHRAIPNAYVFLTANARRPVEEIDRLIQPYLTDDPVFGRICDLTLDQFFDLERRLEFPLDRPVLIVGEGASMFAPDADLLIYADMPRWEIQKGQRRGSSPVKAYKRGYFVDWRVADRWKQPLLERLDFLLDTTDPAIPKLVAGDPFRAALSGIVKRPFRVVPFFDPGPWGGQWMRRVCDLPDGPPNYAWCFNCVPEENSWAMPSMRDSAPSSRSASISSTPWAGVISRCKFIR